MSQKTRYVYECSRCRFIFIEPHIGPAPGYNACPFCGSYIGSYIPKRILQVWKHEGYKGWWIFKKEVGTWMVAE